MNAEEPFSPLSPFTTTKILRTHKDDRNLFKKFSHTKEQKFCSFSVEDPLVPEKNTTTSSVLYYACFDITGGPRPLRILLGPTNRNRPTRVYCIFCIRKIPVLHHVDPCDPNLGTPIIVMLSRLDNAPSPSSRCCPARKQRCGEYEENHHSHQVEEHQIEDHAPLLPPVQPAQVIEPLYVENHDAVEGCG